MYFDLALFRIDLLLPTCMKVHNDHPVAGEIEEEDDEEPQLGEPGGVSLEPGGGAEEEEIMVAVDAEEHEVKGEEQLELNLSDGSEDEEVDPEQHGVEGEEGLELNLSDGSEDEEDDRESSGRASDVSESDEDGEGGRDGEEEEQPELPDPEAPLTDQQINVPRNRKRVVNTLEPARKSKRTRRIPNKFLHFI